MVKPFGSNQQKTQAAQRPDSDKAYFSGSALKTSIITMDVSDWLTVPFWESECTQFQLEKKV